jgi:MtaA/CmuA family methyltransferase
MNSYERVHRLVAGQPVDHLPAMPIFMIWAAQHGGRRHPDGMSYADYVRDYRVLCDCQLRLLDDFAPDVVQLISDPVRETADAGAELVYADDGPPHCVAPLLTDKARLATLALPDPLGGGRMTDRIRGAAALHECVGGEVPIMGWIEGPLAQAVDLRGMAALMLDTVDDPGFVTDLCDWATELELRFAVAQVQAGCDMIGIGDAAASLVSARVYEELVLPREQRLVQAIHEAGALARLHICGNTTHLLPLMPKTGCDIIDLDHLVPLQGAREQLGEAPVILGNFDPVAVLLEGTPAQVRAACGRCHQAYGGRHVVGAGCEVPPRTPEANVRAMMAYACSTVAE